MKKINDVTRIMIAMVLGSLVGLILGKPAVAIGFIGEIWIDIMKMFLVPSVVCMLVKGINSMNSPDMLGRIGSRFVLIHTVTTICVGMIGIVITVFLKPGIGFVYEFENVSDMSIAEMPDIAGFFAGMFSKNMFESFANGNMMQVVIISCFIGIATVLLPEEKRKPVQDWFAAMNDLTISLISIAMKLAPVGIFCLMASTLGEYGAALLVTVVKILGLYYLCCAIGVVLLFSGQAMGISLSIYQILNLLAVVILVTSIGSGIPNGGVVNLMIAATAMGMPLDIIMMVSGFYRLFDMASTAVTCIGGVFATVIVDDMEKGGRRKHELE